MSNEVDAVPEPAPGPPKPALVLIAGEDDLVCVDDTCLPPDLTAENPAEPSR